MRSLLIAALVMSAHSPILAQAQESVMLPYVLSPQVQTSALQPALRSKLTSELGIRLIVGEPRDVARYLDVLTAVDLIAQQRAKQSDRKDPDKDKDHAVGFSVLCFWPNKPPPAPPVEPPIKDLRRKLQGM